MVQLINEDCMKIMALYPNKYFDLAICDPPYGIDDKLRRTDYGSLKSIAKYADKQWDVKPSKEYFTELQRVSKNQIIWGGNYFTDMLPVSECWLVWDKNNGESNFADAELAWTSFSGSVRLKKITWCGSSAMHETGKNKIHPTQKPNKLYAWILERYAEKGQKILDTHLGSGSIAIACHYAEYDLVGVEIDTAYFVDTMKRFKEETSQLRML